MTFIDYPTILKKWVSKFKLVLLRSNLIKLLSNDRRDPVLIIAPRLKVFWRWADPGPSISSFFFLPCFEIFALNYASVSLFVIKQIVLISDFFYRNVWIRLWWHTLYSYNNYRFHCINVIKYNEVPVYAKHIVHLDQDFSLTVGDNLVLLRPNLIGLSALTSNL